MWWVGEEEEKSSFRCVRAATAAVSSVLSSPSSTHDRTSRPAPTTTATATTIESSCLVVRVHTLPSPFLSKKWRPQRRKLSPQAPSAQRTLPLPLGCQCAGSATRGARPGGAHEDRRGRPQSASLHGHARRRAVRGLREYTVPSQKKTSLEDDGVDDSSKEITIYYSKHHNGAGKCSARAARWRLLTARVWCWRSWKRSSEAKEIKSVVDLHLELRRLQRWPGSCGDSEVVLCLVDTARTRSVAASAYWRCVTG
ncbi:hypothetical protein PI125_g20874 [Phytophthora idaei]|nr:hypothetical protein PI125_g20874 [Phytophthora idaei]